MDKLLAADNLCIVALAVWVITLKFEIAAMRKENAAQWKVVETMGKFVRRMYNAAKLPHAIDDAGELHGQAED